MPIPKPHAGESEDDFMGRCMADPEMVAEFPEEDQRAAVCHRQLEGKSVKGGQQLFDKAIQFFKATENEAGERVTVGLMTVGGVDADQEIVDQASVLRAMPEYLESGGPVQYNHDPGGNIGRCVSYRPMKKVGGQWVQASGEEDVEAVETTDYYGKGLIVPSIFHGPIDVDMTWKAMTQGLLSAHSIRFLGEAGEYDARGVRRVKAHRVLEHSVVTVPSRSAAGFAVHIARAANLAGCADCRAKLESQLFNWQRRVGPEQARAILETARERSKVVTPTWDMDPAQTSALAAALHDLAHAMRT